MGNNSNNELLTISLNGFDSYHKNIINIISVVSVLLAEV